MSPRTAVHLILLLVIIKLLIIAKDWMIDVDSGAFTYTSTVILQTRVICSFMLSSITIDSMHAVKKFYFVISCIIIRLLCNDGRCVKFEF